MKKAYQLLIKYPISCLIIIIIWVLCFINIPETPLDHVKLIDKWTHMVMYLGLCFVIWLEYCLKHKTILFKSEHRYKIKKDLLLWAFLLPSFMGGLIEILQANCTGGRRNGDWLDFLADFIGVVLAQLIGILLVWYLSTRRKDN